MAAFHRSNRLRPHWPRVRSMTAARRHPGVLPRRHLGACAVALMASVHRRRRSRIALRHDGCGCALAAISHVRRRIHSERRSAAGAPTSPVLLYGIRGARIVSTSHPFNARTPSPEPQRRGQPGDPVRAPFCRSVEQRLARWAHTPEVAGSNPAAATSFPRRSGGRAAMRRSANPFHAGSNPALTFKGPHP